MGPGASDQLVEIQRTLVASGEEVIVAEGDVIRAAEHQSADRLEIPHADDVGQAGEGSGCEEGPAKATGGRDGEVRPAGAVDQFAGVEKSDVGKFAPVHAGVADDQWKVLHHQHTRGAAGT